MMFKFIEKIFKSKYTKQQKEDFHLLQTLRRSIFYYTGDDLYPLRQMQLTNEGMVFKNIMYDMDFFCDAITMDFSLLNMEYKRMYDTIMKNIIIDIKDMHYDNVDIFINDSEVIMHISDNDGKWQIKNYIRILEVI